MDEPDFFINKNQGVAIVGLGLIGGSIAGALKINGFKNIMGIDSQNKAIEDAINKDFIKLGDTEPENILPLAEIVIVCLYPKETAEFIKKLGWEYQIDFGEGKNWIDKDLNPQELFDETMEILEKEIVLAEKLDILRKEYKKLNDINLDELRELIK